MPDYSNACIYKIVCKDHAITEFYIGSTCNFKHRGYTHKSDCKKSNYKVYEFIRSNGGWDNWEMKLIRDKLGVDNKTDLVTIEGQYQKLLKSTLNKQVAGRTQKEYNKEYMKEYIKKNRKKKSAYDKEYMKEYTKKNREKINKQRRERYAQKKLTP